MRALERELERKLPRNIVNELQRGATALKEHS